MGGPKALMPVAGRAWWKVQEERLAHAGVARTWVVSDPVRRAISTHAHPPAHMASADPDAPMFASVLAGAAAAGPGAGLFILPVDVPAPARYVFLALRAAAQHRASVPTLHGHRGHPIALSPSWAARALAHANPDQRLDHLTARDTVEVEVSDPAVLVNLNTPEDAAAWAARR
jgi:CTP:molybdopterin cytidylyltransferase MocA